VEIKTPLNGGGDCPVNGYFLEGAVTLLGKKFAFSVRGTLDFTLAT
jgi:hypothetical protein